MKLGNKIFIIIFLSLVFSIFIVLPEIKKTFLSFDDLKSSFNENLPFKDNLIKLNSLIDFFIFNKSSLKTVLKGKNNWLFYASKTDGDPIGCYKGENLVNEDDLKIIKNNIKKQKLTLRKMGIDFVIFIAPNKERIYYENMPIEPPAENYFVKQLINYLNENSKIKIIYPYNELMDAKQTFNKNIYYKTDSHWNYIGSYAGVEKLLEEINVNTLKNKKIIISKGSPKEGDLSNMIKLNKILDNIDYYYYINEEEFFTKETFDSISECNKRETQTFVNKDGIKKSVLIIRDSFGCGMLPYLKNIFQQISFIYKDNFSKQQILDLKPDIIIYETVERAAYELKYFSIM